MYFCIGMGAELFGRAPIRIAMDASGRGTILEATLNMCGSYSYYAYLEGKIVCGLRELSCLQR